MARAPDPFQTLGVRRTASDAEVRAAYRRLVQLHHPDHNHGSVASARRFEEVQEAYAQVRRLRQASGATQGGTGRGRRAPGASDARSGTAGTARSAASDDSDIGSRLAAIEQELKAARDEALRQARRAAARAQGDSERASDEQLGYFATDDSFAKILSDAASGLSEHLQGVREEARDSPVTKRFADLIDELGAKLTGEPPDRRS